MSRQYICEISLIYVNCAGIKTSDALTTVVVVQCYLYSSAWWISHSVCAQQSS
jgi:hypothetical protein